VISARPLEGAPVRLADLRVGELIAEGGEGKVYHLPMQPHLVFKSYRSHAATRDLDALICWPATAIDAASRQTVAASAAWPVAEVLDDDSAVAGFLLPRAPKRFSLRHRDGATRLASLSYLTSDPAHRAAAYGIALPSAGAPERFGLVCALARLLDAFDRGTPRIGHGDLSTKNVLWSLQRGPEVFVIDCDNCEPFGADGSPLGESTRRRAMTPNWDDPAVERGSNPTIGSDRYSLALIFLRVVGAANFPMQARQRGGEPVTVEFPLPSAMLSSPPLAEGARLWRLCASGLSLAKPAARPATSEWVDALEEVMASLEGHATPKAASAGPRPAGEASDVTIRPVPAEASAPLRASRHPHVGPVEHRVRPARYSLTLHQTPIGQPIGAADAAAAHGHGPLRSFGGVAGGGVGQAGVLARLAGAPARALRWWLHLQRKAVRVAVSPGRRVPRVAAAMVSVGVDAALVLAAITLAVAGTWRLFDL
jgi:hypothetical protein